MTDAHPYAQAWSDRDLESWSRHLAPTVVLESPLLKTPFHGRDAAIELFDVLFATLDELQITRHHGDGAEHLFGWTATAGGRRFDGVDHVTHDEVGRIARITVYIRPLTGLASFASAVGPPLARRRSRTRSGLSRIVVPTLRPLFSTIDTVATRLAGVDAPRTGHGGA